MLKQARSILIQMYKFITNSVKSEFLGKVLKTVFMVCTNLLGLWVLQRVKTILFKNLPQTNLKIKIKYILKLILSFIVERKTLKLMKVLA